MPYTQHETTLNSLFYKPLSDVYATSCHQRQCPEISDFDFLTMGVERCLSQAKSGHDFLQNYRKEDGKKVAVGHFFSQLASPRRLANLRSVNEGFGVYLKDLLTDELAVIDELKGWHLFAGDGHYHKAAAFDEKRKADTSSRAASKTATGHFSPWIYAPII